MGGATALKFGAEGASVMIGDLLEDEGAQTVGRIQESGGRAEFMRGATSPIRGRCER